MLSINAAPAPVDDSEIEAVKLCLDWGRRPRAYSFIEVGDRVRVRSGLLEGLERFVSRCKNERRFIVLISLINQSVSVEIDVELLELISLQNQSQHNDSSPHGKYSFFGTRYLNRIDHCRYIKFYRLTGYQSLLLDIPRN